MKNQIYLYRYEDPGPSFYDKGPILLTYKILQETEQGWWVPFPGNKKSKKWISKTSRKRFAYPTKEEAMVNYIARKKKETRIYHYRLERVQKILKDLGIEYYPEYDENDEVIWNENVLDRS